MEPSRRAGRGWVGQSSLTGPGLPRPRQPQELRTPRRTTPEGNPLPGRCQGGATRRGSLPGGGQSVTRKRSAVRRCLKMAAEEPQQQKQEPLGSDSEGTGRGRAVRPGLAGVMPGRWFPERPRAGRPVAEDEASGRLFPPPPPPLPLPLTMEGAAAAATPGGAGGRAGGAAQARGTSPSCAPGAGPGPPRLPPCPLGARLPSPHPCRPGPSRRAEA